MTVTFKDLNKKKNQLGQFMTPDVISQVMIDNNTYSGLIIEPSFGLGSFLYKLESKYPKNIKIGIEYDPELFDQYTGSSTVLNQSFYQFQIPKNIKFDSISFVGNPPYRTPAYSLKSEDKDLIKELVKKYKLTGVKEEAIFFIAYAVSLIEQADVPGVIHWILPKTIFENSSKAFTNFRKFLNIHAPVIEMIDISENYPDVAQPLCIAKFLVNQKTNTNLTDSFILKDTITFQEIFIKTSLGSVPCESILLSCKDEPLSSFKERLENIFQKNINIRTELKYNGKYHLRALSGSSATEKFKILDSYVSEIKNTINVSDFSNDAYYKPISHRTEVRWYFRHPGLTKVSFIYIINPNPGKSFYFPGNPTKTSTDYFGYCEYDINRNSSPGANRTVSIENIEKNITPKFKKFWQENTTAPITEIFNYILHISKSSWYKNYKSKYQRFYFGIPKTFDTSWKPELNKSCLNWDSIIELTASEIIISTEQTSINLLNSLFIEEYSS